MSGSCSTGHTLIDEEKKETLKKQPGMGWNHTLNMELDLQSLFWAPVYSCSHWLRPQNSRRLDSYTRALLVSQDRRHLLVTPWLEP
jgi:hypothetical protein